MLEMPEVLKRYAGRIEERLRAEIAPDELPYLGEGAWYQLSTGGKRLRPMLCLATCEALGGDPEEALPFALATEIFHNVLLIHDDIEDGDTMRRDQKTLWAKLGVPNAINISDLLIAKVFELITRSPLPPAITLELASAFCTTYKRTVEGQALDINLRGDESITLETYFRIVQLKTAYYLALPWVGGALIAGRPVSDLDSLWEIGKCLGPAFQIRDDLLDLTEGKGRGGEIGCDLREGKPSILFAFVFDERAGTESERSQLAAIAAKGREETTLDDIRWAMNLYETTGAIAHAEDEAQRLIEKADEVLERSPFPEEGKAVFRSISQYIIARST